jgi:uncharacterized integral membrane protein
MKKSTLLIWAIIFGGIALLIFQNQAFFLADQSLRLNLGVTKEYNTPQLPVAVPVIIFFLTGALIANLFTMATRFKAKRTIKKLNATMVSCNNEIHELRRELESLKGMSPEFEMAKTQMISPESLAGISADPTGSSPAEKSADDTGEFDEDVLVEKKP